SVHGNRKVVGTLMKQKATRHAFCELAWIHSLPKDKALERDGRPMLALPRFVRGEITENGQIVPLFNVGVTVATKFLHVHFEDRHFTSSLAHSLNADNSGDSE